jgi:esterase/lipase
MSFKKKMAIGVVGAYLNSLAHVSSARAGKLAIKLFATPQKGRLTAEDMAYLASAKKHIDRHDDVDIQTYTWQGGDKTVLLVHGWESNSARWQWLIEYLKAENFTIVALDAPAHGASGSRYFSAALYAKMILKVVERVQPFAMIGHSVGGFSVAYSLFQMENAPIEKMILVAAPSNLRQIFDKYFNVLKLNKKVRASYYVEFERYFGKSVDEVTIEHFVKGAKTEGLLIYDKHDDIVAVQDATKIKTKWNKAEMVITEGLGHSLQHEKVFEAVKRFLIKK